MGNTIKDVAQHLHVGWNMVKEIHKKYLKSKYSSPPLNEVHRIGIDEFATRKGHIYKTIVVDLDTGRIIHVGEGKGKEALRGFWKRVRRNKVKITTVTSDLSAAFIASVMENAPNAVHVYDKFHVSKLVNDAVDTVRRQVYAQETDLEKRSLIKEAPPWGRAGARRSPGRGAPWRCGRRRCAPGPRRGWASPAPPL